MCVYKVGGIDGGEGGGFSEELGVRGNWWVLSRVLGTGTVLMEAERWMVY